WSSDVCSSDLWSRRCSRAADGSPSEDGEGDGRALGQLAAGLRGLLVDQSEDRFSAIVLDRDREARRLQLGAGLVLRHAEHVRNGDHLRAERGDQLHGVPAMTGAGAGRLGDHRTLRHGSRVGAGGGDGEPGLLQRDAGGLALAAALVGDRDRLAPLGGDHMDLSSRRQRLGLLRLGDDLAGRYGLGPDRLVLDQHQACSSTRERASSTLIPSRSGTSKVSSPRETTTRTSAPRLTLSPLAGEEEITCPAGTEASKRSSVRVPRSAADSAASASDSQVPTRTATVRSTPGPTVRYQSAPHHPPRASTATALSVASPAIMGERRRAPWTRWRPCRGRGAGTITERDAGSSSPAVSSSVFSAGPGRGNARGAAPRPAITSSSSTVGRGTSPVSASSRGRGRVSMTASGRECCSSCTARSRSSAPAGRCSTERAAAQVTRESSSRGMPETTVDGAGMSSWTCWKATWTGCSPVNGWVPVSISNSTTPSEYRSLRSSL